MNFNFAPRLLYEPISVGAGMAIAAGASALGTGGQIYAAGKMNKKTRQWNEKMYGVQRADALADWNMMNTYNSPEAQMQRFKAAGLNPNLIYGQQNEGATVRSTDVKSWNPETPNYEGFGRAASAGIAAYQDITLQQEQIKNMVAQRENMAADNAIKLITAANLATQGQTMQFDLGQRQALADTSIAQAKETLKSTQIGNQVTLNQDERNAASNASSLKVAAEQILNMRMQRAQSSAEIDRIKAQAENLRGSSELQRLDAELKRQGVQPGDNIIFRILARMLGGTDVMNSAKDKVEMLLDGKIVK